MRGITIAPEVRRRRLWIRIALLAAYLGLVALFFVTGRAHVVLLDNKDTESAEAPDGVLVSVNGGEELELYRGDRDRATVQGQRLRVRLEVFADGTVTEKRLRLPLGQNMLLLSIPALLAGSEPVLVPFVPENAALPPQEEAFSSEDLTGEPAPDSPTAEQPPQ
jgi:hypothetical protein